MLCHVMLCYGMVCMYVYIYESYEHIWNIFQINWMWGHGSWHPNFDTKPHFVGENGLSCELLVPFAAMLCTKPHFLAELSAYLNIRRFSRWITPFPCVCTHLGQKSSRKFEPNKFAVRNAFNYSTMYFQINGLSDTQSAGLSTMFQLACAIGNVLGGCGPISCWAQRLASHIGTSLGGAFTTHWVVFKTAVFCRDPSSNIFHDLSKCVQSSHWNGLEPPDLKIGKTRETTGKSRRKILPKKLVARPQRDHSGSIIVLHPLRRS